MHIQHHTHFSYIVYICAGRRCRVQDTVGCWRGEDRTSCSYSGDSWYSSTIFSLVCRRWFSVFVFSPNDFSLFNVCGFPTGFRSSTSYLKRQLILCRIWQMLYVHLYQSYHGCLWLLKLRTTQFSHLHRLFSQVFEEHLIVFCFLEFCGRSNLTFFLPCQVRAGQGFLDLRNRRPQAHILTHTHTPLASNSVPARLPSSCNVSKVPTGPGP